MKQRQDVILFTRSFLLAHLTKGARDTESQENLSVERELRAHQ